MARTWRVSKPVRAFWKGNQRFQKRASSGEKQEGSSNLYYGENSEAPVGAAGYPDARVG